MDQIIILIVFAVLAAASSWLTKRRQAAQQAEEEPAEPQPGRRSCPRPGPELDPEEILRRLLGGEPARPTPPPLPQALPPTPPPVRVRPSPHTPHGPHPATRQAPDRTWQAPRAATLARTAETLLHSRPGHSTAAARVALLVRQRQTVRDAFVAAQLLGKPKSLED